MAGIPEYWVVDANSEIVTIYRAPSSDGYGDVQRLAQGGAVAPLAFPDLTIAIADIFA
jgi:Uma2 family endonuclease